MAYPFETHQRRLSGWNRACGVSGTVGGCRSRANVSHLWSLGSLRLPALGLRQGCRRAPPPSCRRLRRTRADLDASGGEMAEAKTNQRNAPRVGLVL